MKKKFIKNILGLTLVEILISLVVSSMMMAAMYTTYSIVNSTYGQVVNKAQISRNSRDLVELLIRDIRMAGFKYYLGQNDLNYPKESYLEFKGGADTLKESHDPIIIISNQLGHQKLDDPPTTVTKNNSNDNCNSARFFALKYLQSIYSNIALKIYSLLKLKEMRLNYYNI